MNRNILKNASWIIGCKILQSLLSFAVGMITARYLGPSNYGLISYAASVVAFLAPITKLGFNNILVREIIGDPENEACVLGTSLALSAVASVISVVGVLAFGLVTNVSETDTIIVCVLYSLTLVFQVGELMQYWFQAKLLAKYSSVASLIAYVCVSVYKIYILVTQKSIYWFVITHVLEAAIISVLLFFIYKKITGQKLTVSVSLGSSLFSKSKHYIIAGLTAVLYQQTDRVMLKLMVGETQTGFYSAAFTCIGITAFVFAALIESVRPSILKSKLSSQQHFENELSFLFSFIIYLTLAQGVALSLLAKPMISVMFGSQYNASVGVLRIAVWYVVFSYSGIVRNIWLLAEEKQRYLVPINLIGALFNVAVNLVLIPAYGARGAAMATVFAHFVSEYMICLLFKPLHPVCRIMHRALNPRCFLDSFFSLLRKE